MPLIVPDLLDDEDGLTQACEDALVAIFERYDADKDGALNNAELDEFAKDTNGDVFDDDSRAEITDFLDVNDQGHLTLKGFLQMYNLQTSSDPSETWRDLQKHGYDDRLKLVASRNEEKSEDNKENTITAATTNKASSSSSVAQNNNSKA